MPGPQHEASNETGGTLIGAPQDITLNGNHNYNMVRIRLTLTGWQGSILITSSIDGVNYYTMPLLYAEAGPTNGTLLNGTLTHPSPTTSVIRLIGRTRGASPIRVSATAFTAGTMEVALGATIGDPALLNPGIGAIPTHLGGNPAVITRVDSITGAVTDQALVSATAGQKVVAVGLTLTCGNANTLKPTVRVGFGAANTPALGNVGLVAAHPGIDPGGGLREGDGGSIIGVGADGEDLRITCTDPGGVMYVTTKILLI